MRRSTVPSLPLQLVFPGLSHLPSRVWPNHRPWRSLDNTGQVDFSFDGRRDVSLTSGSLTSPILVPPDHAHDAGSVKGGPSKEQRLSEGVTPSDGWKPAFGNLKLPFLCHWCSAKAQANFSLQGWVFNFRSGCMYTMHLLPSVAIQPNIELKTRPKELLGSLLLVISLPGQSKRECLCS